MWGSGFLHAHPRVSRRSASRLGVMRSLQRAIFGRTPCRSRKYASASHGLRPAASVTPRRRYAALDPAIRPVSLGVKLVGRAFTVACCNDFLTVIKALQDAAPGDVLVVDGQQGRTALADELFATEAKRRALPASWSTAPCAYGHHPRHAIPGVLSCHSSY